MVADRDEQITRVAEVLREEFGHDAPYEVVVGELLQDPRGSTAARVFGVVLTDVMLRRAMQMVTEPRVVSRPVLNQGGTA